MTRQASTPVADRLPLEDGRALASEGAGLRAAPLIVSCALFMQNLDSTAVSTSLPQMAVSFGIAPLDLSLVISGYLLAFAMALPISGWLAGRFGARLVFLSAIALFAGASLLCALSGSAAQLVAARGAQGVAASMMVPVGRLIVVSGTPRADLVRVMAQMSLAGLVGPTIGPLVGGFLTTYTSWHWIFLINVPIAAIGIVLGLRFIPDIQGDRSERLDPFGIVTSSIALVALMAGLQGLGRSGFSLVEEIGLFAMGAAAAFAYVRHSLRIERPVLDLSLFRVATYRAAILGGGLFRMTIGAIPFLLPMMLQLGFGLSPMASGSLTFAAALGSMSMKSATLALLRRFGFRSTLTVNAFISAILIVAFAIVDPRTPWWIIWSIGFAGGLSRSLQFTGMNSLAYADLAYDKIGRANTMSAVAQQLSVCLGVAVSASVLFVAQKAVAVHALNAAPLAAYSAAFVVMGMFAAISGALFLRLPHDAGAELSGRPRATPPEPTEP